MANDTQGAEAGALKQGATAVRTAYDNIQGKLHSIDGTIGEISGVWSGSAHTAFHKLMTTWNEEVTTLNKILTDLEEALGGAESDRVAMEEEGQQTINDLSSLMSI